MSTADDTAADRRMSPDGQEASTPAKQAWAKEAALFLGRWLAARPRPSVAAAVRAATGWGRAVKHLLLIVGALLALAASHSPADSPSPADETFHVPELATLTDAQSRQMDGRRVLLWVRIDGLEMITQ